MKTIRISPIIGIALLLMTTFTACKKEAELHPELSARVVGNYTLTALKENGKTYTINAQTKGKMNVVRESATSVGVTVEVTNSSSPADNLQFSATGVSVEDAGNGEVNLSKNGSTFAKGGNNSFTIKLIPNDGSTPFELVGTK
ncbi:hypothetical protein [Spirosoma areae]